MRERVVGQSRVMGLMMKISCLLVVRQQETPVDESSKWMMDEESNVAAG